MSTPQLVSRHQPIRKYNPGRFQSDHEVVQQFVVRKREFHMVLDILSGNIDSASCQHVLLVAPRGMGKSMMLARLAAEIRSNGTLAEHLLPVRFMEESHEILRIADFWLELLSYLAKEIALNNTKLAANIHKTYVDLATNWDSNLIEDQARSAVFEIVNILGKRLVVMCENMQAICENVNDDFGWKLREILQMEPQIMLLATATGRFKTLDDVNEPYFELFRVFHLDRLENQECRCLWQMITGDSVSESNIRPLEILTGGNPRLLITMADFAEHRSIRQLMDDLVVLVDNHTEYFRGYLEALPKTERRVYLAVIDLWKPSTLSEIATRARVDTRIASTMLKRLLERGSIIVSKSKKKRIYMATERLFSIYHHLRTGDENSTILRNILRFMSAFYSPDEMKEMSYDMILDLGSQPSTQPWSEETVTGLHDIDPLPPPPLVEEAAHLLSLRIVNESLSDNELPIDGAVAMILLGLGIRAHKLGNIDTALAAYNAIVKQFGDRGLDELQLIVAQAMLNYGVARGQLEGSAAELVIYDEILDRFDHSDIPEIQWIIARLMLNQGIIRARSGETEVGLTIYECVKMRFDKNKSLEIQALIAEALIRQGDLRRNLGETETALMVYDEVIDRFSDHKEPAIQTEVATALFSKGITRGMLGDIEGELTIYDEVIERFGVHKTLTIQTIIAKTLVNLAHAQSRLGNVESALNTYEEVIRRYGDSDDLDLQESIARSLFSKAVVREKLEDFATAFATYDEVIKRFGDSERPEVQDTVGRTLVNRGLLQRRLGEPRAALAAYDEIMKRFGDNRSIQLQELLAHSLFYTGFGLDQLGDLDAALSTYGKVIHQFADSELQEAQVYAARALMCIALAEIQMGRTENALHTCDELRQKFGSLVDNISGVDFRWRAGVMQIKALLIQGKNVESFQLFCSIYREFIPKNRSMISEINELVLNMVSKGISEKDVIAILSSDEDRSSCLLPLISALIERTGEVTPNPPEVAEVALDILKEISARIKRQDILGN